MPEALTPPSLEQIVATGVDETTAADIRERTSTLAELSRPEGWRRISREVLRPDHPFALHQLLFRAVYEHWDEKAQGPPPAWIPSPDRVAKANLTRVMQETGSATYSDFFSWSVNRRMEFWAAMIRVLGIRLDGEPAEVADLSRGAEHPRWLPGITLNIARSCFQAESDAPAVLFAREADPGSISVLTYRELEDLSCRVANGLREWGLEPGDAVAVDMSMTPPSVAIYLGCVLAGCVVVSIADSFAPHEIATRLRIAGTKAVFTQDFLYRGGKRLPLYAKVVEAQAPKTVVLPGADEGGSADLRKEDRWWNDFLSDGCVFEAVSCQPDQPTNILFSSGTTGDPKAIPWTHTTPIKCAADGFLHHDIHPGDVVAWPTSLGWMMGPWLIYASLINRGTVALFDGIPTGREFGQFVQAARVTMLGVVPALVRAWKTSGVMAGLDWSGIKAFSSTGEASNAEDMLFLMSRAGYRPIIEYCGGTEIGGGYVTGTVIQPASPSTFSTPALGLDLVILDENGEPADNGEVFLVPPSIGLSTTLLNKDHHEVYYDQTPKHTKNIPLRRHGDQLERLPGGFYRIHGRVDDTMNLGGIKVSSAEIERVLNAVDGIRETAAIAVSRPSKLVVFVVPEQSSNLPGDALKKSMQSAIRDQLNPLFRIHDAVIVDALPRTASNKVMRRVLRDRYETD